MDYSPIPVISVKRLCDVEISLDGVSITTKKRRKDVLAYSFEKLCGYFFVAFGVDNYTETYFQKDSIIDRMKAAIFCSEEKEIGFCFSLP